MRTHQHLASAKLAATAIFVALIVACGGTASPAAVNTPQSARFPVTITSPGGTTVTLDHQPRRIVSLSPTATEMLFAIGAGSQVIAVDDQSNYPAEALQKPHDLSGYQPNVEAIAKLKP